MASLAILGLALTGCSDDPEQPTAAPPTTAPPTTAPAASAPSTTAPPPAPTSAPVASSAAAGSARYTVRQTRPAGAEGGAGATLVLAKASTAEARAAIGDYFRRTPPKGYLSVEALGRAGGTEWICMGERVTSADDLQYAIFEGTQAITDFPGQWIECRD